MVIRCCFICVFAMLMKNKVCLQETVTAVIGGSVLLPCSSTEHDLKPQDTDVLWRHNGSKNVYDIVKGKESLEFQDPRYKNRAERLPDEYEKGNFSIKLNNLTHTDAGKYICYITLSSEPQSVQLIINVSTAGNESKSTEKGSPEDETGSVSVETSSSWLFFLLIVPIIILAIIGYLIFLCYRKKKQALSFSFVCTEDKTQ
ncbi:CD276 antigen homolog isoform X1 [Pimephales promelas]|uniref:CD276 antigen homolog isoform X1 n=1 Tax=Pimephales promelas TaxID=90988 RepID=UPI001955932E|nr:CD276 antigen homolog isoform X1 [Pimephales promelas]